MAGARAMVPMGPKDMVHVVYQATFDPEKKIAAAARKAFKAFDERITGSVIGDTSVAPQVLGYFAVTLIENKDAITKLLTNRAVPDSAFAYVGGHSTDHEVIGMVAGNQERLIRDHSIVRAIADNEAALRSDLDRAIDFMVREGIFLEDFPQFEDAFMRLGKGDMLKALQNVEIEPEDLTPHQAAVAEKLGCTPEEVILGTAEGLDEIDDLLPQTEEDNRRKPLGQFGIPQQVKIAMSGDHAYALEGLKSQVRLVASAAIRNPRIKDADIPKIAANKSMHEDVIRYICNNGDWTKAYTVKLSLVQNPKTPPSLITRWMPLLRATDLKQLSKSKQVPQVVSITAKRMLMAKQGGNKKR